MEQKNEADIIKAEHKSNPSLWCRTYTVTIKRPLSDVYKRNGMPYLVIDICGSLDGVCASADIWGNGLSAQIRDKFKEE